jgi:hypothetical protein
MRSLADSYFVFGLSTMRGVLNGLDRPDALNSEALRCAASRRSRASRSSRSRSRSFSRFCFAVRYRLDGILVRECFDTSVKLAMIPPREQRPTGPRRASVRFPDANRITAGGSVNGRSPIQLAAPEAGRASEAVETFLGVLEPSQFGPIQDTAHDDVDGRRPNRRRDGSGLLGRVKRVLLPNGEAMPLHEEPAYFLRWELVTDGGAVRRAAGGREAD